MALWRKLPPSMEPLELTSLNLLAVGVFWAIVCYRWLRHPRRPLPTVTQVQWNKADELPLVSVIVPALGGAKRPPQELGQTRPTTSPVASNRS